MVDIIACRIFIVATSLASFEAECHHWPDEGISHNGTASARPPF
jgi:hypothetical protein